jgi:hypothetical protein
MFGPHGRRDDGTYVFASPIGEGHIPMVALSDIGFFARYSFDNRALVSGKDLEIASDWVGWDYLVETFIKVTGQKAVYLYQPFDEWVGSFERADAPLANERPTGDGSTTWKQNFRCWWNMWHDDLNKRDFEWIRKVNPNGHTLESWMRANNYTGRYNRTLLKNAEDGKSPRYNLRTDL